MRNFTTPAFGLILLCAASPAAAQLSANGPGSQAGAPTATPRVPDIAPPALPGAGAAPLATGPVMQKPTTGDPTQELFTAVNSGDYTSAQDALSRGANLSARNDLGETPLDLSIALNRSQITFLLLATRNETGGDSATVTPMPASAAPAAAPVHHHLHPAVKRALPALGNNPGTPDPSAGFLGFGPKS
jgi:hypothetical protein